VRAIEHEDAPASKRTRAGYERADPTAVPIPASTPAPVTEFAPVHIPLLAPFSPTAPELAPAAVPVTDAMATMVPFFQSVGSTVQGVAAEGKDEEIKAARMFAEQIARNKQTADQDLRQGSNIGPEDPDWQRNRWAILDSNLCEQLDVIQPETAVPSEDAIALFHALRLLEAKGCWVKQDEMT
jgi:hypothetical protein